MTKKKTMRASSARKSPAKPRATATTLKLLRAVINDDRFASSFQSMAGYRTELLVIVDRAIQLEWEFH